MMSSNLNKRTKILLILSFVCLAITVTSFIWLTIYLDVKPGHSHRIFNNQIVIYLKSTIWVVSIASGLLLGWCKAIILRSNANPDSPFRRRVKPIIFGILLCLWSIERLVIGISPVGTYDYLGSIGIKPSGIWYNFDAVIAAVILILTATCGAYLTTKGLIPSPVGDNSEH